MNKIVLEDKGVARLDQNAAAIYLTSLNSDAGRRNITYENSNSKD